MYDKSRGNEIFVPQNVIKILKAFGGLDHVVWIFASQAVC